MQQALPQPNNSPCEVDLNCYSGCCENFPGEKFNGVCIAIDESTVCTGRRKNELISLFVIIAFLLVLLVAAFIIKMKEIKQEKLKLKLLQERWKATGPHYPDLDPK